MVKWFTREAAHHYPIDPATEPEVAASVARIGKYIAKSPWLKKRTEGEEQVYSKTVHFLPEQYKTDPGDDFVVFVGAYTLKDKTWDETAEGGMDFRKGAVLECHFKANGEINTIYYPL